MHKYTCVIIVTIALCCTKKVEWAKGTHSKEALVQNAITYISKNDNKSLATLFLSREEHNQVFWSFLPDKFTKDKGMPADSAYDYMSMETNIALRELRKQILGKDLITSNVECKRPTEIYGPFKLHLGCSFKVKSFADGEEFTIHNIHGIIEFNNEFKIYNFKRN